VEGWEKRKWWLDYATCWSDEFVHPVGSDQYFDDGWQFFDDAWWGRDCHRNWYTGNIGSLGDINGGPDKTWVEPHYTAPAPGLLGFDRNINWHCGGSEGADHANACVRSNINILSLFGDAIPYNMCRNLEWQMCAAKGTLPGQRSNTIIFSYAPKDLEFNGGDFPLGGCNSYAPLGCEDGYSSGDVFSLEVCIYDAMCSNRESMWELEAGDQWQCDMEYEGYQFLFQTILNHTFY